MLDHGIEELREFVNNYRLMNSDETHTRNGTTRQYSNDELIKLLESDTLNMEDKQGSEYCAEKIAENYSESQGDFNVLKVKENGIKGLTVEVRENLYSKFNTALSINYKTTYKNQSVTLTDANICDIAKKIEFSILSIATDLNSYKLSGAEKVINIEKQTRNKNLCEALRAEIELLKLRDQIQTAESKDDPQEPSSVLIVKTEAISRQDDQSSTDIAVNAGNGTSIENESDKYFSCNSGDHSPTESQQENQSCTSNSDTRNPVVGVRKEKTSEQTELTNIEKNCQTVSTTEISHECNKNYCSEKNTTEANNVLRKIHKNNGKDKFDLVSTERVSLNNKRKRRSKSDEESANKEDNQDNKENIVRLSGAADTRIPNSPPSKKKKTTSSEVTTDTPDSTTSSETYPLDRIPLIANIKLEPGTIKSERFSPPPNDTMRTSCNNESDSLENSSNNEIPNEKCGSLDCNEKEISSGEKIEFQAKAIKSEIVAQEQNVDMKVIVRRNVRCVITNQIDISNYSPYVDIKENFDKQIGDINVKIENPSPVDVDSSNILNDNRVLQNPELNTENDIHSMPTPPRRRQNIEKIAVGGSNSFDDDTNNDHHERSVVVEKISLIDEEAFELERARLDREYEEMKKQTKESENKDFIYGDHERIFEIIVPIIREYYPSDYIPEEWSYGKILQRLQIDLAEAEMSDEEMASYTRDSIKTMRYLCDHCIVQ